MADPGTGTSTRGTGQRGTTTDSRGTEGRKADTENRGIKEGRGLGQPTPGQPAESPNAAPAKHVPPANVWAFRIGRFLPNTTGGWTHVFKIRSFKDLVTQLEEARLQGKVSKLVIVAHGNSAGLVQMDRDMNPDNVASFADDFKRLATFLSTRGKLMFESCQAGAGDEGSLLLTKISSYLQPDQYAIGFMVNGFWAGESLPSQAGDSFEAPNSVSGMPASVFKNSKRMTEDSAYAKWAQDGRIVRLPLPEEFTNLKGSWMVIAATANAKSTNQLKSATLKIDNDPIQLAKDSKVIWSGTYKIDLTYRTEVANRPRTIDIKYTAGKNKDKTALGILRFGRADFNTLTICLAEPSGKRPDDFTSPANSGRLLMELKRRSAR